NPAAAQHIHEVVRDTVRAQRALPDFGRSPISSHIQLQAHLASKRCRPKYRDEPVNVRPLGSRPLLHPSHPEIQTSPTTCYQDPQKPESTLSSDAHLSPIRSSQSFKSETGSYMEMNSGRQNDGRRPAMVTGDYCGMDDWEPAGKQQSRYMMMSPQVSHSSPVLPQDEYMTMASPQKHESAHSPLQTSFSGSTSDSDSPLHPQHGQTSEHSHPHWLLKVQQRQTDAVQSQRSISCSTRPQDDERQQSVMTSADQTRLSAQTGATSSPVRSGDGSGVMAPFVTSAPSYNRPVQASSYSGTGRSSRLQAASDRSVRRNRLFLCLPSCLQAKNRS
ncbi:uncharacterized protein LOC121939529, partial [Plectropomus leopardus]|uniref:uncharacterized protein LOC121939529 n=1 Tax=Plectropomus leopardus TaxID=160734 RepID=UPI001C4BE5E8